MDNLKMIVSEPLWDLGRRRSVTRLDRGGAAMTFSVVASTMQKSFLRRRLLVSPSRLSHVRADRLRKFGKLTGERGHVNSLQSSVLGRHENVIKGVVGSEPPREPPQDPAHDIGMVVVMAGVISAVAAGLIAFPMVVAACADRAGMPGARLLGVVFVGVPTAFVLLWFRYLTILIGNSKRKRSKWLERITTGKAYRRTATAFLSAMDRLMGDEP